MDEYVASVWDRLRTALWDAQAQSTAEACRQKWYYDRKIGAVNLKPGNLVLVKADAFKGRRKIKNRWEEDTWEVVHHIMTDVLLCSDEPKWLVTSPAPKPTSTHCTRGWHSFMYRHSSSMGQVYQPHPMQDYFY